MYHYNDNRYSEFLNLSGYQEVTDDDFKFRVFSDIRIGRLIHALKQVHFNFQSLQSKAPVAIYGILKRGLPDGLFNCDAYVHLYERISFKFGAREFELPRSSIIVRPEPSLNMCYLAVLPHNEKYWGMGASFSKKCTTWFRMDARRKNIEYDFEPKS